MEVNNKNMNDEKTRKLISNEIYTKRLWVCSVVLTRARIQTRDHKNKVKHLQELGLI